MSLIKHTKTLLVIVAEAALEKNLVRDARERGAQSWSIGDVHSAGREGVREGAWEADRTIELKLICEAIVADAIAEHIMITYAQHYAIALYFSDVKVLRPERY